MENLKCKVMLDALKSFKGIDENKSMEKEIMEAIYQLEDINQGKAFIKNISRKENNIECTFNVSDLTRFLSLMQEGGEFLLNNEKRNCRTSIVKYHFFERMAETKKDKIQEIAYNIQEWAKYSQPHFTSKTCDEFLKIFKEQKKILKEIEKAS
jgi:hypothetical protein